jgi:hypothetical protein
MNDLVISVIFDFSLIDMSDTYLDKENLKNKIVEEFYKESELMKIIKAVEDVESDIQNTGRTYNIPVFLYEPIFLNLSFLEGKILLLVKIVYRLESNRLVIESIGAKK